MAVGYRPGLGAKHEGRLKPSGIAPGRLPGEHQVAVQILGLDISLGVDFQVPSMFATAFQVAERIGDIGALEKLHGHMLPVSEHPAEQHLRGAQDAATFSRSRGPRETGP